MKIKEAREKIGMTQAQFGKLMGMSQSRISEIEHNANFRIETFQHKIHLIGIEMLVENDLLEEFQKRINKFMGVK